MSDINFPMSRFSAINLFHTELDIRVYAWKLPKSHIWIPLLRLRGHALTEADIAIALFRFGRVEQHFYRQLVVLDLTPLRVDDTEKHRLAETFGHTFEHVLCVDETPPEGESTAFSTLEKALRHAAELMKKHRHDGGKNTDFATIGINVTLQPPGEPVTGVEVIFKTSDDGILLVEVAGDYPSGSAGDDEGDYIKLCLEHAFKTVAPKKLIVDMGALHYEWGDSLFYAPFQVMVNPNFPYRLVVSDLNEPAIRSLYPSEKRISHTLAQAVAELEKPA